MKIDNRHRFIWYMCVIVSLFPLILLLWKSLTEYVTFEKRNFLDWTVRGYATIWQDPLIGEAVWTTSIVTVSVVLVTVICAYLAGKVLAYGDWRGKVVVELLLFSPLIVPVIAIAVGLQVALVKIGVADTILGVIMIHLLPTLPYAITMMRSGFERIGKGWREQALLLHPSRFRVTMLVELQMLLPTIRSVVFLTTVISLSQYALTAIIGGGNVITIAMLFFPYANTVDDTMMAAFAIVFASFPIIVVVVHEVLLKIIFYLVKRRWLR